MIISMLLMGIISPLCSSSQGGFPHGFGGHSSKPIDKEYYDTLGIDTSASEKDIKRAYRHKAMKTHPDKGGNEEDFKKLNEAYEILCDPNKRKEYDRFGKSGATGIGSGGDASNMNDFFRGFSGFSMPQVYTLELSLEDFYSGNTLQIGLGSENFDLTIEPGMFEGLEIRGKIKDGRGHSKEVIFILQEKQHPVFSRMNADLYAEVSISIAEALLGFEKELTHLDGKTFTVTSNEGEITSPDDILMIPGLGMPIYKPRGGETYDSIEEMPRGRLFIKVKVDFPRRMWLDEEGQKKLSELLPNGRKTRVQQNKPASETDMRRKFTPLRSDLKNFGKVGGDGTGSRHRRGSSRSFFFDNIFF